MTNSRLHTEHSRISRANPTVRLHRLMNRIHQLILAQTPLQNVYEQLCELLLEAGHFAMTWIAELSPSAPDNPAIKLLAVSVAVQYSESIDFYQNKMTTLIPDYLLQAFRSGDVQIVQDVTTTESMASWRHHALQYSLRSLIGIPIVVDGSTVCVLSVAHANPSHFRVEEVALLQEVADLLAVVVKFWHLEKLRAEHELRWVLSAKVFESLDAITVTDADGNIVLINDAFTRFTGYQRAEVIGNNPRILQSGRHDKAFYDAMWKALMQRGHWEGEIWNRRKNGEIYSEWLSISSVNDDTGKITNYVAHFLDTSQMKAAESEIQRLAYFDPLTGLANRRRFFQVIEANDLGLQAGDLGLLLFVDVDRFKEVNDSFGHAAGDQLLQMVAQRLIDAIGENTIAARLGGDEFVVLHGPFRNSHAFYAEAKAYAEAVRAALCQPYPVNDGMVYATASVGLRAFKHGQYDWEELMKGADLAMYQAKNRGGNQTECYDPDLLFDMDRVHAMSGALRDAVQHQQIELYMQGQFDQTKQLVGVEVLSRWNWQEQWVSPAEFIALAERRNLIKEFDLQVIRRTLDVLTQWNADHAALPKVSVNISSISLHDPAFLDALQHILQSTDMDFSRLVIEITETALLDDSRIVRKSLDAMTALGIGISLDDFGTGYSSLSHLRAMPVTEVKIDRTFVQDLLVNPRVQAITESLLALCSQLKIHTVAEGVETLDQVDWLAQAKCSTFQGYYFMKPEPADVFSSTWLK